MLEVGLSAPNYADQGEVKQSYGGWWWLRSPNYNNSNNARNVNNDGNANNNNNVNNTNGGVVPDLLLIQAKRK